MTGLRPVSKTQLDPSIIGDAPIEPAAESAKDGTEYLTVIGQLASELEEREAELIRLKGKKTVDEVRAQMLERYSDKVFCFVVLYCVAVGAMLLLAGFGDSTKFRLSDTILGIIAGSTAVSVIGLIGMVVSGLFGGVRTAAVKSSKSRVKKRGAVD